MKPVLLALAVFAGGCATALAASGLTMDQKVVVASRLVHPVRVGAGGFDATARVDRINERINSIIAREPLDRSNIHERRVEGEPAIYVGPYLVATVTEADAAANGVSKAELARIWLARYRQALPLARPDANWGVVGNTMARARATRAGAASRRHHRR